MESEAPVKINADGSYQPPVATTAPASQPVQPGQLQPSQQPIYGAPMPGYAPGYGQPQVVYATPQPGFAGQQVYAVAAPGFAPQPVLAQPASEATSAAPAEPILEDRWIIALILFILGFFTFTLTWIIGWCMFGARGGDKQFTPTTYRLGRLSRGFMIFILSLIAIAILPVIGLLIYFFCALP